jgi:hypothetical protein
VDEPIREETLARINEAFAAKAIEPQCLRCRSLGHWTWIDEEKSKAIATRVCQHCGAFESYDLALLLK